MQKPTPDMVLASQLAEASATINYLEAVITCILDRIDCQDESLATDIVKSYQLHRFRNRRKPHDNIPE